MPHQYQLRQWKTPHCPARERAGDSLCISKPHGHRKRQVSVSDHNKPKLAQRNRSCWVKTASALRRAYLNCRSSHAHFYTLLTTEVPSNFVQKLSSHSTKLLLSLKRTRRDAFVFREMLIWNAQRVTLSITVTAYIDYKQVPRSIMLRGNRL